MSSAPVSDYADDCYDDDDDVDDDVEDDDVEDDGTDTDDGLVLTDDQQAALTQVLAAIRHRENVTLRGVAGAGKTTLLSTLVDKLIRLDMSIKCATPTHKAAAVLRSKINAEIETNTTAALLGMRPSHRGKLTVFTPDWNMDCARRRMEGTEVLIVDEASMCSQFIVTELAKLCRTYGTVLVLVGDPCQLPPVDANDDEAGDSVDESSFPPIDEEVATEKRQTEAAARLARGSMSREFVEGPGPTLTQVVRHSGPVLALATATRQCSSAADIAGIWPTASVRDGQSSVTVWDQPPAWIDAAAEAFCSPSWPRHPDLARMLTYTNRSADSLTVAIRNRQFGADAALGWAEGEVVANGDAINQPGLSLERPLCSSSCEWIVADVSSLQFDIVVGVCDWFTPARREERSFEISTSMPLQRLTLEPLFAGRGQVPITVMAVRPGDRTWHERLSEISTQIKHIPAGQKETKKQAWKDWHSLKAYVADIRSAAVQTVHRSQGSTYRSVWINSDLSFCKGRDSVPLHYTALTRASDAVHVLRRW
jgi:exodeoxyribonuclease-5